MATAPSASSSVLGGEIAGMGECLGAATAECAAGAA
jgi:hypothetical protein